MRILPFRAGHFQERRKRMSIPFTAWRGEDGFWHAVAWHEGRQATGRGRTRDEAVSCLHASFKRAFFLVPCG